MLLLLKHMIIAIGLKNIVQKEQGALVKKKTYAEWFVDNCDNKNPGVVPEEKLEYDEWFVKHCTPSEPVDYKKVAHEPYMDWFQRHHA